MLQNLKKLRLGKNISQQKLADAVFVSQQSINKYENQDAEPDIDTLIRIADYFDTTIDYLVGNSSFPRRLNTSAAFALSLPEVHLVNNYRLLNTRQRESIELVIDNYLGQCDNRTT